MHKIITIRNNFISLVIIKNFTVHFNKHKVPIAKSIYLNSTTERGALFVYRLKCD
jgi:hypothetical protein